MENLYLMTKVESSDDDLDEEDASKHGRESDKTKSMFQDSDFDVLDEDMEDVEGEIVHTATTGVSTMKEEKAKETGVSIKDVEDSPRPIRSITTLQPLLTIDPKKNKQKQEEATNAALAEEFDEIQARIDADHELAVRLTHEEQEKYTIEERARLLAEFFERKKVIIGSRKDQRTLFKPNEEDEIWKNQQDYNLNKLELFRLSGVQVLLMNTGDAIHMMFKKKYSSTQEMLSRNDNQRTRGLILKVKWHLSFSDLQDHNFRSRRVFGYILLMIKMLIQKKLDD
ncbi:hypothetical protein Tco_0940841 [Tanacetum coccineum]|uniref:Uncharacterized protein n=1 Tax=Tanacetum coccineum TaxID=301880 RepID=A0ABQ5DP52_9ASTR